MTTKRVLQLGGVGALVLLAVLIAAVVVSVRPSHALETPEALSGSWSHDCRVGDREYYGLVGFRAHGSSVHFRKVDFVGVPKGLSVLGVQAVSGAESPQPPLGQASAAEWRASPYSKVVLHPVTDVVVRAGEASVNWWLLIEAKVNAPGEQTVKDVKVSYTAGGRHGTASQRFQFGSDCK